MTILLMSPTGTIGKQLVRALLDKGASRLRLLVRNAAEARTKVKFDQAHQEKVEFFETKGHDDPSRDTELFAGVERVWVLCSGWSKQLPVIEKGMVERARKHSPVLKQVVLVSGQGADATDVMKYHKEAEQSIDSLLRSTTVSFTVLRPNVFMQNFLRDDLYTIKNHSTFYRVGTENPSYRISHVDVRDIAESAAVVLTADPSEHADRVYTISGPESLDYTQISEILSEALFKKINVVFQTDAEGYHMLKKFVSYPMFLIQLYQMYRHATVTSHVFGDVEILTGHPARSFKQFVQDHKDAFL